MSKQVLDIQQMQHLKELGVDTSNGSAYWYRIIQNKGDGNIRVISDWKLTFNINIAHCTGHTLESVRTFTLQDILELLPKKLVNRHEEYELTLFYSIESNDWNVQYLNNNVSFMDYKSGKEIIDAAYEMLCWVLTNKYIQ